MSIHDGHRKRLKERFLREGLDKFEQHQVLELLLFYGVPQRDTNEIAHELMRRFGSLSRVLEAPAEELMQVRYVGDNVATLFKMITEVARYYQVNRAEREKILTTIDACGEYLVPFFYERSNETVFLLCLDAKCKVLDCALIGEGSVNSAGVPIRKIVELALKNNATSAVLAHNHPSGLAIPSREDVQTTRRVAMALDAVEVQLVDHIIVAEKEWVSLAQSGLYHWDDCRILL